MKRLLLWLSVAALVFVVLAAVARYVTMIDPLYTWSNWLMYAFGATSQTAIALSLAAGTLAIAGTARKRDWSWLVVSVIAMLAAVYGPLATPLLYPIFDAHNQNPGDPGAVLLLAIDTGWAAWPAAAALALSLRPRRAPVPDLEYSMVGDREQE